MKNLLIVFAFLLASNLDGQCDRVSDSLTLVQFYQATNGPNWVTPWDLNSPISTWYGIRLSTEGCVEVMDLDPDDDNDISTGFFDLGINGKLTPSLKDLKFLKKLIIYNAILTDSDLDILADIPSLDTLSIRNSELTGTLPTSILALENLTYLSFTQNNLTGEIPLEYSEFKNIKRLFFSANNITGTVPTGLTQLDSLVAFGASSNDLEGTIPEGFELLPNFLGLALSNNDLSGCIPSGLVDSCHISLFLQDNPKLPYSGDFEDACSLTEQIGAPCDDGYLGTVNDSISEDCGCYGEVQLYECWCDISGEYEFATIGLEGIDIEGWCTEPDTIRGILEFRQFDENSYDVYRANIFGAEFIDMSFGSYSLCYGEDATLPGGDLKINVDCQDLYWSGTSIWDEIYSFDSVYISEDTLILEISNDYGERWKSILTRIDDTVWEDEVCLLDEDGDGFVQSEDCNDFDANVNSAMDEVPYNGIDDDCDASTLDDDLDGDGFTLAEDCNDLDSLINPLAEEIVNNEIDENCDGILGTSSTFNTSESHITLSPNPARDFVNLDLDGFSNAQVKVYSHTGELVKKLRILNGTTSILVSDVPRGVYFVEITFGVEQSILVKKLVLL